MSKNTVESSEISQVMSKQTQPIQNMPLNGEISPKQHEKEGHTQNATETGKISPNQPHEQGDLEAMEEGVAGNTPTRSVRDEQGSTHYTAMGEYNMKSYSNTQQEPPQQSPQREGA